MRELDVLLTRYLVEEYPRSTDHEKSAFEALLQLSDPELAGYLLKGERSPDPAIEGILAKLRGPD